LVVGALPLARIDRGGPGEVAGQLQLPIAPQVLKPIEVALYAVGVYLFYIFRGS
jgi:hypothetical protein